MSMAKRRGDRKRAEKRQQHEIRKQEITLKYIIQKRFYIYSSFFFLLLLAAGLFSLLLFYSLISIQSKFTRAFASIWMYLIFLYFIIQSRWMFVCAYVVYAPALIELVRFLFLCCAMSLFESAARGRAPVCLQHLGGGSSSALCRRVN